MGGKGSGSTCQCTESREGGKGSGSNCKSTGLCFVSSCNKLGLSLPWPHLTCVVVLLKHRNATLRSKAEAKGRTLLGVYGRIVAEAKGLTSLHSFERAFEALCTMVGPEVCVL